MIDRDGRFAQRLDHTDVRETARPATAQLTVACTVSFSEKLSANSAEVR